MGKKNEEMKHCLYVIQHTIIKIKLAVDIKT